MRIGLIDVDGHNFPNLALMRISAYHKAKGDTVEWWFSNFEYYDKVYMSKIFSTAYSPDMPEPYNVGEVIKGGTGYCISINNGQEIFDKAKNTELPAEIEQMPPDYTIYPQYDFAVSMTSRGCPRGCAFCHVGAKEGRCAHKVANVNDFWKGQKNIVVLDPNITALRQEVKADLFRQYKETGAAINFSQGLDIRLLTEKDIQILNDMRLKNIHFAWDNAADDLKQYFEEYARQTTHKISGAYGAVYVLTGYNSTEEQDLYRIYTLRDLGFDPYVMIYNKPNDDKRLKKMQRWCNSKFIFKSVKEFKDYV